ncbi:TPA: hypothetical protein ACXK2U_003021 [Serratia marcescens]
MGNVRLKVSTRILNSVEGLPRFQKGLIASLQDIREQQHIWSNRAYEARKAPENSAIMLEKVALTLTFEHEDFKNIIVGLKQYFPKNEKIQTFINSLKMSIDNLNASSWHELGFIAKEKGRYIPDVTVDKYLPQSVDNISLSFHRILPSVACLIFEFNLDNSIGSALNILQNKVYLGPVEFKKFFPIRKIHDRYSMGTSYEIPAVIINNQKDVLRKDIEDWIKKGFKWNSKNSHSFTYVDVYSISGNPTNESDRREWWKKNSTWLNEYGININSLDILEGDSFLISKPKITSSKYKLAKVMAKFETVEELNKRDFFKYKLRAIAISEAILNVVEKYSEKIKSLRGNGFENLYKGTKITRKNQKNIQEIKRVLIMLSRLEQELEQSNFFISHSLADIGELQNLYKNISENLATETFKKAEFRVKTIKEAILIVDTGLTNYLSVQSIYVMYKLQKWMFVLSIVVTIATIIGVLSGWENIIKIFEIAKTLVMPTKQ